MSSNRQGRDALGRFTGSAQHVRGVIGPDGGVEYRDIRRSLIEKAATDLDGLVVTVGFQGRTGLTAAKARRRSKARKKGERGAVTLVNTGLRVVDVATIHEFGSKKAGIPERSFLRATMRNNASQIRTMTRNVVQAAMAGQSIVMPALRAGLQLETATKRTITELRTPPLAESTLEHRFRTTGDRNPNPLVDTGQLRASITHKVTINGRTVGGNA